MAESKRNFILFITLICCAFSIHAFSSEHSHGDVQELVEFLNEYEEVDFFDKERFYEFENAIHSFDKNIHPKLPIKIEKEQFEEALLKTLDRDVKNRARPLIRAIVSLCEKYQVDPYWVTAMVWTESHFKINARSNVGARGLMQVMPATKRFLKRKMERRGIEMAVNNLGDTLALSNGYWNQDLPTFKKVLENLEIGIFYIQYLNKKFNNSRHTTVAYNMGPNWVWKSLRNNREVGSRRNIYLNKVKRNYAKLAKADKHLYMTLAMN